MASGPHHRRRRWYEILAFIALTIILAAAISIGGLTVCRVKIDLTPRPPFVITPTP